MSEHAGALGQAGAATSSLQTLTLLPAVLARLGPKVDKIARCPPRSRRTRLVLAQSDGARALGVGPRGMSDQAPLRPEQAPCGRQRAVGNRLARHSSSILVRYRAHAMPERRAAGGRYGEKRACMRHTAVEETSISL